MHRLGQTKGANLLHACHRWQPTLLLLLRAKYRNGIHRQPGVNAEEGADAGIASCQFQRDQPGSHHTQARAAISLDAPTCNTERCNFGDEFKGELGPLPVVVDDGDDLCIAESAHFIPNSALFLSKKLIHQVKICTS